MNLRTMVIVVVVALPGCAHQPRVLLPVAPRSAEVAARLAESPLAAGENIRATPLLRGEQASVTLVQIRDREAPHVHTRYDITVTLMRGAGTLHLAGEALPMRAGDAAFVPRGTPHFFVNDGREPAAALVSFAPPFDGPDQEPSP
jgi:quercetin dioxygenase-like cupin family protein